MSDRGSFPYDPAAGRSRVEVAVRCQRCATRYGEPAAAAFGLLVYAAHLRDAEGRYVVLSTNHRAHWGGSRVVGWAWFPVTDRLAVRGAKSRRARGLRGDRTDVPGEQLHCSRCGAAPRVNMERLHRMAHEAASAGRRSVYL